MIEPIQLSKNDTETFAKAVFAVCERTPDSPWRGWDDADHILTTYGFQAESNLLCDILDRAIDSEGASLAEDEYAVAQGAPVAGWTLSGWSNDLIGRNKDGWNIVDERSDKSLPLERLLLEYGVFLDQNWSDYVEIDDMDTVHHDGCGNTVARHLVSHWWAYLDFGDYKSVFIKDEKLSLKEWLATCWDTEAYGGVPELLAAWRFDAEEYLDVADEEYDGPCKVWIKYQYFQGSIGSPLEKYASADDGSTLEFSSYEEALEWVEDVEQGVYLLHSGEASPPEYIICKIL